MHKRAEALRLRGLGMSNVEVAKEMGISGMYAGKLIKAALLAIIEEPAAEVIKMEITRLDVLYQEACKVLRATHPFVQQGGVVYMKKVTKKGKRASKKGEIDEEDEFELIMLEDCGPRLAAIDRCLRVQQRRAELLGLDKKEEREKEPNADEFAARIVSAVHAIEARFAAAK